jgi:hypothetical protein
VTDWTELFRRGWPPITVNLHIHGAGAAGLGPVLEALTALTGKVERMSGELERLTTEVEENTSAIDSAIVLIRGMAEQIRAAGVDPAKLKALADTLDAKSGDLARAVLENTPEPVDPPPPEDA